MWKNNHRSRTTDTQWRHKSKISVKVGRCGRQNMLRPYLKIWDWDWIFGRAVKAISSPGVRSPWLLMTMKGKNRYIAPPLEENAGICTWSNKFSSLYLFEIFTELNWIFYNNLNLGNIRSFSVPKRFSKLKLHSKTLL